MVDVAACTRMRAEAWRRIYWTMVSGTASHSRRVRRAAAPQAPRPRSVTAATRGRARGPALESVAPRARWDPCGLGHPAGEEEAMLRARRRGYRTKGSSA